MEITRLLAIAVDLLES